MLVEFTRENAERCKALLAKIFAAVSKHERPKLEGDAATVESFLNAAGQNAAQPAKTEVTDGRAISPGQADATATGKGRGGKRG